MNPIFRKLAIELQSYCNRKCSFCSRSNFRDGIRKAMPTKNVLDILGQAHEMGFRGSVAFHQNSEPLYDDRLIAMAQKAKELGMKTNICTNGDLLQNNEQLCQQVTKAFDAIVVGLYDDKSAEERKTEMEFWKSKLGNKVHFSCIENVIPRAYADNKNPVCPTVKCTLPSARMIIHYDGNMALCCDDIKNEFNLGNAFESPLKELWWSEKHLAIITALSQGQREKFPMCSKCPR